MAVTRCGVQRQMCLAYSQHERKERSKTVAGGYLEDRRQWRGISRLTPFPGVKDIWEDRVLGARGLCRETHRVEMVGVLAYMRAAYLPQTFERQPGMFLALLSSPSARPSLLAACRSASPQPPAAPNAARMCPHLHSKVDINTPLKQLTVEQL